MRNLVLAHFRCKLDGCLLCWVCESTLILRRGRCPSQRSWCWRPWSRSNGRLFSGCEVGERFDVRAVRDRKFLITAALFAVCAIWPGRGGRAGSGENASTSLSQSVLPGQDFCGAIARRCRPADPRNESTYPDAAASRSCSWRIAGIASVATDGNDRQPRYDTPSGEDDLRPSPGGEGAGAGCRRLGLTEAGSVRVSLKFHRLLPHQTPTTVWICVRGFQYAIKSCVVEFMAPCNNPISSIHSTHWFSRL